MLSLRDVLTLIVINWMTWLALLGMFLFDTLKESF